MCFNENNQTQIASSERFSTGDERQAGDSSPNASGERRTRTCWAHTRDHVGYCRPGRRASVPPSSRARPSSIPPRSRGYEPSGGDIVYAAPPSERASVRAGPLDFHSCVPLYAPYPNRAV